MYGVELSKAAQTAFLKSNERGFQIMRLEKVLWLPGKVRTMPLVYLFEALKNQIVLSCRKPRAL